MSEGGPAEPEVQALPPPAAPMVKPRVKPRRPLWPLVFALGFLLLAGGEAYLWVQARAYLAQDAQARGGDATELAVLRAQVDDLRAAARAAAPAPDSAAVQADLGQKYADLAAEVNAVQAQVAGDHGALSMMQANATDLGKLTQRMTLINALGTARLALDAGQPLGTIPNAPPALARFATVAPPTEAQLREDFAAAARAAEAASLSANGGTGFWVRVKLRLEGLITISDGDRVVFGPPAAAALDKARAALEDGDLAGAVAAVQGLNPGARAAMAGWLAQAQALLAARAALLAMAQGA